MIIFRWILLRTRNVSDEICTENQNTHFVFDKTFLEIVPLWDNVEKIWQSQTAHRRQYNTAHVLCMLDNYGCRHILRKCNTYCFSKVAMLTRTRISMLRYTNTVCLLLTMLVEKISIKTFNCDAWDLASWRCSSGWLEWLWWTVT